MGVLLVVLSLVPAVGGFLVLTSWLPSDIKRYREYTAAEPCPAGTVAAAGEDCVRTYAFTVEKTEIDSDGRSTSYTATLTMGPSWRSTVDFVGPDPVLEVLEPGDRVSGTVWRRQIMTLSKGGLRQDTAEAPRDDPQMIVAMGTFLGLLAALGLVFGAVRVVRPRDFAPFGWRPYGKILVIVSGAGCVVVGLPAVWLGWPSWIVPAVVLAAVGVTAWQLYLYYRPSAARDA
jgi:hypothetical protein